jgi:hypothetical protein
MGAWRDEHQANVKGVSFGDCSSGWYVLLDASCAKGGMKEQVIRQSRRRAQQLDCSKKRENKTPQQTWLLIML